MTNSKLIKSSLINSVIALLYISGVALLMTNAQNIFGKGDNVFTGIAVLMLFVISAAIMGFVILGRPILMYLDGLKKDLDYQTTENEKEIDRYNQRRSWIDELNNSLKLEN